MYSSSCFPKFCTRCYCESCRAGNLILSNSEPSFLMNGISEMIDNYGFQFFTKPLSSSAKQLLTKQNFQSTSGPFEQMVLFNQRKSRSKNFCLNRKRFCMIKTRVTHKQSILNKRFTFLHVDCGVEYQVANIFGPY